MARQPRLTALAAVAAGLVLIGGIVLAITSGAGGRRHADVLYGANGQFLFGNVPAQAWPAHIKSMADAGVQVVRYDAQWAQVEPQPPSGGTHSYQWGRLDGVVAALAARKIRWLPIVDYSAPWSATRPGDTMSPPARDADFAAFARAIAARYGRNGSFWDKYPELPEVPVTSYEIWNEPNHPGFWHPAPDPRRYVELYLAARSAVRDVDPDARVIFGGLTEKGARSFLHEGLTARRDARPQVDAVGYHPYGTTDDHVRLVLDRIAALRATLVSLGMARVPIDLTEIGWTTSGQYGTVTDNQRAAYYRELVARVAGGSCRVESVIAHTWVTLEQNPGDREQWFGLYHPNAVPTAAGRAYSQAVRRAQGENGPRYRPDSAACGRHRAPSPAGNNASSSRR